VAVEEPLKGSGFALGFSASPPAQYPEHVCRWLEDAIIDGRLAPGERVTETQLSETFGVSRTPIREATRILEARGLIIRRPNRGTFVASRTTRTEAETLYRLRIPLETHLAASTAKHIDVEILAKLRRLQAAFREALSNGESDPAGRQVLVGLDSEFHWTIYRAAKSDLVSIVGSYWGRLLRELSDRTYRSEAPARFADQHDDIVHALERADPATVAALMENHIKTSWRAVALSYEQASTTG
jgi:DNA-binding GntR family transcriptional regulator